MKLSFVILTLLLNTKDFANIKAQEIISADDFEELWYNITDGILAELEPGALDFLNRPNFTSSINITADNKCLQQLQFLQRSWNLTEYQGWAWEMVDASAKIQAGLLWGNWQHLGNFDECLKISGPYQNTSINGQYCTSILVPHEKYGGAIGELFKGKTRLESEDGMSLLRFSYGFCLPSTCISSDLNAIFTYLEEELKSPVHFIFDDTNCSTSDDDKYQMTTAAICALTIFGAFGIILVLSTAYDMLVIDPTTKMNIFRAFSLKTNSQKLFSTDSSAGNLGCLNGLRVISMMWIVLCHRCMFTFYMPQINAARFGEWMDDLKNSLLYSGGPLSVDTFFIISGLLVSFYFFKGFKGLRSSLNSLPLFYFHRIWRLTPALAMAVLFSTTLINYMGSGPYWMLVDVQFQKPCQDNWWSTLIYLQNYLYPDQECIGQSWYLAVDTQMFFLSPLVLLPLARWPKKTIIVVIGIISISCAYSFALTWIYKLGCTFFDQDYDYMTRFYTKTHIRGNVYLIGLLAGYYIHKTRNTQMKLCKSVVLCSWIICLLILFGLMLCQYIFVKYEYNVVTSSLYNAFARPLWALNISAMIVLCFNGYGGLINDFLSCKLFTILIRLNYSIYLLHVQIIICLAAQIRAPILFRNFTVIHDFLGDYIFTAGAAIIWCLAFESSMINLEKICFGQGRSDKNKKSSNGKIIENEERGGTATETTVNESTVDLERSGETQNQKFKTKYG